MQAEKILLHVVHVKLYQSTKLIVFLSRPSLCNLDVQKKKIVTQLGWKYCIDAEHSQSLTY